MDCPSVQSKLEAAIEEARSPELSTEEQEHLNECEDCRIVALVVQTGSLVHAADNLGGDDPSPSIPEGFADAVMERVHSLASASIVAAAPEETEESSADDGPNTEATAPVDAAAIIPARPKPIPFLKFIVPLAAAAVLAIIVLPGQWNDVRDAAELIPQAALKESFPGGRPETPPLATRTAPSEAADLAVADVESNEAEGEGTPAVDTIPDEPLDEQAEELSMVSGKKRSNKYQDSPKNKTTAKRDSEMLKKKVKDAPKPQAEGAEKEDRADRLAASSPSRNKEDLERPSVARRAMKPAKRTELEENAGLFQQRKSELAYAKKRPVEKPAEEATRLEAAQKLAGPPDAVETKEARKAFSRRARQLAKDKQSEARRGSRKDDDLDVKVLGEDVQTLEDAKPSPKTQQIADAGAGGGAPYEKDTRERRKLIVSSVNAVEVSKETATEQKKSLTTTTGVHPAPTAPETKKIARSEKSRETVRDLDDESFGGEKEQEAQKPAAEAGDEPTVRMKAKGRDASEREAAVRTAVVKQEMLTAALLLKIPSYCSWPNTKSPAIGVLGSSTAEDQLAANLRLLAAKMNPPVIVNRYNKVKDALKCHLLFVGKSERNRIAEILVAVQGQPILTVSELPVFCQRGGMIRVNHQGSKKFEINLQETKRARIQIRTQLLRLSKIVQTQTKRN